MQIRHGQQIADDRVVRASSRRPTTENYRAGQPDIDDYIFNGSSAFGDGRGGISAFKVKAMAVRLRRRLHRRMNSSYTSLATKAQEKGSKSEEYDNWGSLNSILFHPFSLLLVAFPLGLAAEYLEWGQVWIFWLNITALVPLAKILGDGTEELATAIKSDTLSGLLNATLGNAVEIILSIQTLRRGLLDIVKATLLGSILSNILLVLGTSFLLGGIVGSSLPVGKHHIIHIDEYQPARCTSEKEHIFSVKHALVNMGMQLLACMTIALPTVFASQGEDAFKHLTEDEFRALVVKISRIGACIIILSYAAYIFFQLSTHKRMLKADEGNDSEDEDEDEPGGMSAPFAFGLMLITTCLIAVSSELLVGAIEHVVQHSGMPGSFIGIILLPFAGNACEHASAVRFAIQDRPGLSIGIAIGSSTQIALFVVPLTVIMGWAMDKPMNLVFGVMNTSVMIMSVLVVLALVIDGRSNWVKGFMLVIAYVFCAVLYWHMPPKMD